MKLNILIAFLSCCIVFYFIVNLLSRPQATVELHHHHHPPPPQDHHPHLKVIEIESQGQGNQSNETAAEPCPTDSLYSATEELFQLRKSLMASHCQLSIKNGIYPKERRQRMDQIVKIFKTSRSVSYGFFVDEANENLMCLFVSLFKFNLLIIIIFF